tara:strand:- start:1831 stop:2280 length:450 start_codon:yes stop_codon:yes gene_type:complete
LNKTYKSVGAIIFYKGKYLIQLRDKKKNIFFPGFWGIFGGSIKKNENKVDALKRELKEEINIDFKNPIKKLNLKISSNNFKPLRERTFFLCEPKNLPKKINIYEGKKFDLISFKKLKKLKFIPWDFSAISYHYYAYVKKQQIIPKKRVN